MEEDFYLSPSQDLYENKIHDDLTAVEHFRRFTTSQPLDEHDQHVLQSLANLQQDENVNDTSDDATSRPLSVKEVKWKLKVVFNYHTSYGDRLNMSNLKASKLHKMMEDAKLMNHYLNKKRIDLMFIKANRHWTNMTFETFLSLLTQVAQYWYPSWGPDALRMLVDIHFLPLYDQIVQHENS